MSVLLHLPALPPLSPGEKQDKALEVRHGIVQRPAATMLRLLRLVNDIHDQ